MSGNIVEVHVRLLCDQKVREARIKLYSGHEHSRFVQVHSGQSIQAAINKASPGTTIFVGPGTYAEQLTINKDDISLIGSGAVLTPPAKFKHNTCTGYFGPLPDGAPSQAGICVTGSQLQLAPYDLEHKKVLSVGQPVNNVLISGMEVSGFVGADIAVVGAQGTRIIGNELSQSTIYGLLTVGSTNSYVAHNKVVTTLASFVGICQDNLGSIEVEQNYVSGHFVGLCVQTSGANIHDNTCEGNCIGAYVDPHISGVQLLDNHITGPTVAGCPAVYGIILDGASDTLVKGNSIHGERLNGAAAGIAIYDDPCDGSFGPSLSCDVNPTPANATGDIVIDNKLSNNDVDILVAAFGNNIVRKNRCSSSSPAGLCS